MKRVYALVLVGVLLAGGALYAGGKQESSEGPKVYKLGVMTSLSGTFAAVAETQKKAILLAVEQKNQQGGLSMPWGKVKIETSVKDDEAKLDVGIRRCRELQQEGIHALVGTIWNPMAAALNEEMKITPMPYLAACVPALDSFKKGNPAVATYSVAFTPWSIGYLAGASSINKLGKKKIFFLARSDSWGRTIFEGVKAAAEKYGGEIVGYAEAPLGTVDFSAILRKVIDTKPDVFMASQFAGDAIAVIKQAYDMGVFDVTTVYNTWITSVVGRGIPDAALSKVYALMYHYHDLSGLGDPEVEKRTLEYRKAYEAMWNEPPDAYGSIAYVATQTLFWAVEKAGSFDAEKVGAVMAATNPNNTIPTIKGDMFFREDQEMVGKYLAFLVKGKPVSERKDKWDVFEVQGSFGGEEALPSLESLGY
ncbi:MAG: urea ABC transporter substrate-binding protein [Spirochaetales bacterium]